MAGYLLWVSSCFLRKEIHVSQETLSYTIFPNGYNLAVVERLAGPFAVCKVCCHFEAILILDLPVMIRPNDTCCDCDFHVSIIGATN